MLCRERANGSRNRPVPRRPPPGTTSSVSA